MTRAFLALLPLLQAPAPAAHQADLAAVLGTWDGTHEPAGVVGGDPCSLLVERGADGAVEAVLVLTDQRIPLHGAFDAQEGLLTFETPAADGEQATARLDLRLEADTLVGQSHEGQWVAGFRLARTSEELLPRDHARTPIDLAGRERPLEVARVGLELEAGFRLDELMQRFAEQRSAVGIAVACAVDGEVVDVRSLGWEDVLADVPATSQTRYRWASISKPLTATTALRLEAAGRLDLERDVRAYVPEFPEKEAVVTAHDILCHQSGITHYRDAVRTWREYAEPHPFERLVNGLDLFRESPLLFAPGTRFSYSTHAWTLLGVVLERAAERPYAELVRASVLEPAGMTSTEPDYPSSTIPHRTRGYERSGGHLFQVLEDDVSWKLPGGGWTSTVEDLARFGAALTTSALLGDEQKARAWAPQRLADGSATEVGLGFFLSDLDGRLRVSHSGGQRKASTYLTLLPEERLAVAVMCNTEGTPTSELALGALLLLLEEAERR